MKKTLALLSFGLIFLIAGCASSGNQILRDETEESVSAKITANKTTKNEIKEMFGSPEETTFTDGGKEIWKYFLIDVSADAISYVPIVNIFASSSSGTKKELVVLFNGNIVERFSMSESDHAVKYGLAK